MQAERRRKLALFWHIHQPFFVPDAEVLEQVSESYEPLLDVHERLELPLSLNVSGGLLLRLQKLAPAFVERLRSASERGLVEIVGSGAFHALLPLLPLDRARRQIAFDVETKQRILGVSPKGFWPADLGFSQFLVPLLAESGIEWTVVDGAARVLGSSLPGWERQEKNGQAVLAPRVRPLLFEAELGRAVTVMVGSARATALARHPQLTWRLVDLESGVLHRPDTLEAFIGELEAFFASGSELCVLGDDGERINGRTMLTYRTLLERLSKTCDGFLLGSDAVESARSTAEETYLPTSTFLVDLDAWLSTADDWVSFRLLDDLHRELQILQSFARVSGNHVIDAELREISDQLMPLEDSGFYFWKFLRRTREPFVARILELRRRLAAIGTR